MSSKAYYLPALPFSHFCKLYLVSVHRKPFAYNALLILSIGHSMQASSIIKSLNTLNNNRFFQFIIISVIIISALMIGVKTYDVDPAYLKFLTWIDIAITYLFLFEIIVRFLAEGPSLSFFKKGWNIFDTLIVAVSLIPIDDSEVVLLARLVRIFRVLRLISIIPELRILISALIKALPPMGYVLLLMFIIFYIYAAVG
ncbi:MAG: ion transporter, partial [Kangiellaceae bacterium]|nr:ion transporter [Kangiellaceae bacterium]